MIVLWRVTQRCNLGCGFCAYDRRLPGPRDEVDVAEVERIGALLGAYCRVTGQRVLLSWLGGEPLLWRPVFDVSRRLREAFGIDVSATTNGTTLHQPAVIDGVLDAFAELTVSVDGMADFHDRVRRSNGLWTRLQASVARLAQARTERGAALKLRANIVLMRDNVPEFERVCHELAGWGIDEITFNPLGGRDRPEFFPPHGLRPDDVRLLLERLPSLREELAARGVRLCAAERYLQRVVATVEGRAVDGGDCAPGEQFWFIDERGRVAPCSFTASLYGLPVAELRDLHDLLDLPARFRAARSAQRDTACNDCQATHRFAKFGVPHP